ncbi:MAG: TetR/AcrR family transcriptional regulator [Pseudomonadota bacterium]|nr:TetR/AcrR family transcriptional regulator [Pseudomonadota bacterium]
MNKRQENALMTKQNLIDTTLRLIEQKGFDALNVEDITSAAGCAKGTFYVYFKHKEDVVFEICRPLFGRIKTQMTKMNDKNIIDRLQFYFVQFMTEVERYGINLCREWLKGVLDPAKAPENMDNAKWQFDVNMLHDILCQAVQNKELAENTPVELLTHLIISELYGMMTCWCMSDGEFEPKNWIDQFFAVQMPLILEKYLIK